MKGSHASVPTRQVCTFTLDGLLLGVDVTQVQEVIRYQEMTPVPLSSPVIRGLINLRGHIVSALDLRLQLDLAPRPHDELPMNVVVHAGSGLVSLLVDEIGDVVDVDASSYEAPPATLDPRLRELIRGVYKLEPQLLLLLDTQLVTRVEAHRPSEGSSHV